MNESERDYEVEVYCVHCEQRFVLKVRFEDYLKYCSPNRPHIQDIFPYLTPAERELLISQTCDKCWKKMISFLEEDEE